MTSLHDGRGEDHHGDAGIRRLDGVDGQESFRGARMACRRAAAHSGARLGGSVRCVLFLYPGVLFSFPPIYGRALASWKGKRGVCRAVLLMD